MTSLAALLQDPSVHFATVRPIRVHSKDERFQFKPRLLIFAGAVGPLPKLLCWKLFSQNRNFLITDREEQHFTQSASRLKP